MLWRGSGIFPWREEPGAKPGVTVRILEVPLKSTPSSVPNCCVRDRKERCMPCGECMQGEGAGMWGWTQACALVRRRYGVQGAFRRECKGACTKACAQEGCKGARRHALWDESAVGEGTRVH